MSLYPFQLDPFQERALAAIDAGASVLLSAPTGVGKTVVAELAIDRALAHGKGALYAAPVKALSNQKHADFCVRYGPERVGILTGDRQENPSAPLLVLTTEILHNRLVLGELAGLQNVGCLVFDEFHYLSDPERGSVWEETIILRPRHIQIVCLSATLPNLDELAGWLEQHVERLEVIAETARPVPLSFHYFAASELHSAFASDGRPDSSLKRFDVRPKWGTTATIRDLLPTLMQEQMTPALCFVFSRRDAERQAAIAAEWLAEQAPADPKLDSEVTAVLADLDPRLLALPQAQTLRRCLQHGVGFHHAGLVSELKKAVEQLFGRGVLRVLCATETFAVGLNMPARTVALPRLTKFDGRTHRDLSSREFQQMIGRAGRRGMDEVGHVVLCADPWKPFSDVARLLSSPLEPIRSAFAFSYNTLLNVSAAYGEEATESLVSRTFLVYQLERELRCAEQELAQFNQAQAGQKPTSRKQIEEVRRRAKRLRGSLELGEHRRELDAMRSALTELGYTGSVPKAALARGIVARQALLLVELLDDPWSATSTLDGPGFAELISWFNDDTRRKPFKAGVAALSPQLRQARQVLQGITARVQRAERNGGMVLTRAVVPVFPFLIYRCCSGESIRNLCRDYQLAEGDVIGQVERTRQLLRQVSRAASAVPAYSGPAALARLAVQYLDATTDVGLEADEPI